MGYAKHTWLQRLGVKLNRFKDQNNVQYEFTSDPQSVSQAGTPFSAAWMNEMEDGIYNADRRVLIAKSITTTWTGTAAPYTQTIAVSGLTTSDILIIGAVLTGVYADDMLILRAWSQISRIKINAGTITVYANAAVDLAIPIQILIAFGANTAGVDAYLCGQGNTAKKTLYATVIPITTTWVAPPNLIGDVTVRVFGGGGGGGGGSSSPYRGGGGGGGEMQSGVYTVGRNEGVPVTIGAGGYAGSGDTDGSAGGVTSFGAYISANGGSGGKSSGGTSNGGAGGTGGGGGSGGVGGAGQYGGGGGAGSSRDTSSYSAAGGAGGTYGGGGGSGLTGGGGAAGGAGTGAGGGRNTNGTAGTNTTATTNEFEFKGTGAGGAKGTSYSGGGGGGIGGVGGAGSSTGGGSTWSTASGGGGGYGGTGGKGGNAHISFGGGGGGGGGGWGGAGGAGDPRGTLGDGTLGDGGGGGGGGYGANGYGAGGKGASTAISPTSGVNGVAIVYFYVIEQ